MRISIEMGQDEVVKAREAAIAVLSKLAPYDEDVAKALEGMLTDDFVGRLPEAIRALVTRASAIVEEDLTQIEDAARG